MEKMKEKDGVGGLRGWRDTRQEGTEGGEMEVEMGMGIKTEIEKVM